MNLYVRFDEEGHGVGNWPLSEGYVIDDEILKIKETYPRFKELEPLEIEVY